MLPKSAVGSARRALVSRTSDFKKTLLPYRDCRWLCQLGQQDLAGM